MVINTLVNEVEELICANACSDRCIDVARYFECKHPCCIKTALMLDWCIECGCNIKNKEKVRLVELSPHKRCLSDNYYKTCLKAWNARARMARRSKTQTHRQTRPHAWHGPTPTSGAKPASAGRTR